MSQPIIDLSGVDLVYDDGTHALKGVDLSVGAGDRIALLGANGAGKSTLFLVMAGILEPARGSLLLSGKTLSHRPQELRELRSRVGLVFQDPDVQLFANTVAEDVGFGPLNAGFDPSEVDERVDAALTACGIADLADKPPHFLSYGQKKLAAIAGIVAMGCDLYLFDEPTSGLDGYHAERVEELLHSLNAKGAAVVVSTHDIEFAWRFAHEAVLMRKGRIVLRAEPETLFRRHRPELSASHISVPLVFDAAEALSREIRSAECGGSGASLPPPPRRTAEIDAWSRAVAAGIPMPCSYTPIHR